MYFKDRDNTNIDDEFENNNILSLLINIFSKYKIILIILLILIISIIIISLLTSNKSIIVTNNLVLNGDEVITVYEDSDYIEPGFNAYNSKNEDLTSNVNISSNLDTSVVGEYEITYMLDGIVKTRKVIVVEKPKTYTFIRLNTIDNSVNIYLKLGEEYNEPGYQVFSSTGENLSNLVEITGSVDTSKKGNYTLIYSVVDASGVTVSTSRIVTVMDTEINLSLSTSEYTNSDVIININVVDEFFDYVILPDGSKITDQISSYKVSTNGKYTFKTYSTKGMEKEASITVNNINKTNPTGSCSGSFENGVSSINVSAKDDIGIKKYEINGSSYTNSKITINKELSSVSVRIYDKAGNTKDISCNLEDKNKPILFGDNIKLNYQYFNESALPYALYSPSMDNKNKKIPLIVWLHGSGEIGVSESAFKNSGLLKVLNNWNLEGFNAYILCPRLPSGSWAKDSSKTKLFALIDKIVQEKNIDMNKIVMTGHSMGGIGAQYMTFHRQNYFSAMVVLSGYNTGLDLAQIKDMPVKGYVGTTGAGEDSASYNYTVGKFTNIFGSNNVTVISTSHGNVPKAAFNEDKNSDGRSDLIEWMLTQELK